MARVDVAAGPQKRHFSTTVFTWAHDERCPSVSPTMGPEREGEQTPVRHFRAPRAFIVFWHIVNHRLAGDRRGFLVSMSARSISHPPLDGRRCTRSDIALPSRWDAQVSHLSCTSATRPRKKRPIHFTLKRRSMP